MSSLTISNTRLYLPSGYLNMGLSFDSPFSIWIGGRGIGKTYGIIDECLERGLTFMLIRRTQTQADIIAQPQLSPIVPNCRDRSIDFTTRSLVRQLRAYYYSDANTPFGYTAALSTFANLRGFSAQDIKVLIYDEFIGQETDPPLKHEFSALLNCYETINRNRELQGEQPLRLVMMANSYKIANPIMMGLQLVQDAYEMRQRGDEIGRFPERGLNIYMPLRSEISEKKSKTALYQFAPQSYTDFALNNQFQYDNPMNVGKKPLKEYRVLAKIGELSICAHKSSGDLYITTEKTGGCSDIFTTDDTDIEYFRKRYMILQMRYMAKKLHFFSYAAQAMLENIIF